MFSPELLDHFQNPRNVGELSAPAKIVEVTNPACGDILRLSILWDGERISRVAFKVRGCTASLAAGSALTLLLQDHTRAEAASLTPERIEAELGGLPEHSRHAAVLCIDAVRAALK